MEFKTLVITTKKEDRLTVPYVKIENTCLFSEGSIYDLLIGLKNTFNINFEIVPSQIIEVRG